MYPHMVDEIRQVELHIIMSWSFFVVLGSFRVARIRNSYMRLVSVHYANQCGRAKLPLEAMGLEVDDDKQADTKVALVRECCMFPPICMMSLVTGLDSIAARPAGY